MKYVIVGGVAGGATVASRLRRMDEQAEIILFERGKFISYANCGLPYYIGGTIAERGDLLVQTEAGFKARYRVDVRTRHEVTRIFPDRKKLAVQNIRTGEKYEEEYDKLILSTGGFPYQPAIGGISNPLIFTLRSLQDVDFLKKFITNRKPKKVVVVGGGFIGLEMAENLMKAGLEVTLVESTPQVMPPLDYSMAAIVHKHLREKGVELVLNDGVFRFEDTEDDYHVEVELKSGRKMVTNLVILSIGVRPETLRAREAHLEIGKRGGILVNPYLQTSDPDIYALGDAVEVEHLITHQSVHIPLAGPANKQARIVADNLVFGNTETYKGSMGTSIAKVFDLTVAAAGANAKLLQRARMPFIASWTHGSSHADYYPGAQPLSIKVLFAPETGVLLGAQVIGTEGVDKRIEMLAQLIQHGGTVQDLMELEHAYAPPYSSAKDPVNIAGFVADNILKGRVRIMTWREVARLKEATMKIDVRTREEFAQGSIPGFINIPVDELREHLSELPRNVMIVLTCAVGLRGYVAYRILTQSGFNELRNLSGGYKTWYMATHY